MKKPTLQEIEAQCAKVGLPKEQAAHFLDYYESVGWKIGKHGHPMVSWPHAVANWKRNHDKYCCSASEVPVSRAQKPAPTVFTLKTVIEAKQEQAEALYSRNYRGGPLDEVYNKHNWDSEQQMETYRKLKKDIKALKAQLADLL